MKGSQNLMNLMHNRSKIDRMTMGVEVQSE